MTLSPLVKIVVGTVATLGGAVLMSGGLWSIEDTTTDVLEQMKEKKNSEEESSEVEEAE